MITIFETGCKNLVSLFTNLFCKFGKTLCMSKEELKKELHKLIDNTEDEELLSMVKEDMVAYQTKVNKNFDDLSDLSPEDRADLEELATEDMDKDTISFEALKKEMNEWVSKL
jgi:argonaute-like protein implicated in RNA metabolism and viral defense